MSIRSVGLVLNEIYPLGLLGFYRNFKLYATVSCKNFFECLKPRLSNGISPLRISLFVPKFGANT